jgi:hypothetical protein
MINNGQNLVFIQNTGKLIRSFGPDDNVVGPVEAEKLIEKEFKGVARNIDVTVANAGFNTVMKKMFKLIGGELECRLAGMLFKEP